MYGFAQGNIKPLTKPSMLFIYAAGREHLGASQACFRMSDTQPCTDSSCCVLIVLPSSFSISLPRKPNPCSNKVAHRFLSSN